MNDFIVYFIIICIVIIILSAIIPGEIFLAMMGGLFFILGIIGLISRFKDKKMDPKEKKIDYLGLSFFTLIGGLLFFIPIITTISKLKEQYSVCYNGKYATLFNDYEMNCEVEKYDEIETITYSENTCRLTIRNDTYIELYDKEPLMIKCEEQVLDQFIDYKEGVIEMLYDNLKDSAYNLEKESTIIISTNDVYITITYYPKTEEIRYRISEKTSNRTYHNSLEIMHFDDEYQEFDKNLIRLLFNKDIEDFDLNKNDNYFVYSNWE